MAPIGHNGGPPLDDEEPHVPEWEDGDIGIHFAWKRAHAAVWRAVPWETMLRRQERAERIGLTYEEYTLELLERGRHLGPDDAERVAAIKQARKRPHLALSREGEGRVGREADRGEGPRPDGEARRVRASTGRT